MCGNPSLINIVRLVKNIEFKIQRSPVFFQNKVVKKSRFITVKWPPFSIYTFFVVFVILFSLLLLTISELPLVVSKFFLGFQNFFQVFKSTYFWSIFS